MGPYRSIILPRPLRTRHLMRSSVWAATAPTILVFYGTEDAPPGWAIGIPW